MPPRNPLRESNQPQEQVEADQVTNTQTNRAIHIVGPNGAPVELDLSSRQSQLLEDGVYSETVITIIRVDAAGNPLPDDPEKVIISHTGLFPPPEQRGICSSGLHNIPNRNTYLGQDGRMLPNGNAICNRCEARRNTIILALTLLAGVLLAGIIKGLGVF